MSPQQVEHVERLAAMVDRLTGELAAVAGGLRAIRADIAVPEYLREGSALPLTSARSCATITTQSATP